jgi:hypothetical protein
VEAWLTLPRRIYLDTLTLQTCTTTARRSGRTSRSSRFHETARSQVSSTRSMPCATSSSSTNGRASTSLVTEASLREVAARNEPGHRQWVDDVLDGWLVSSEGEEPFRRSTFDNPRFGNISVKDRRLLQDALDASCDSFMTIERTLPTVAAFVEKMTGLRIMRRREMMMPDATSYRRNPSRSGQPPPAVSSSDGLYRPGRVRPHTYTHTRSRQ